MLHQPLTTTIYKTSSLTSWTTQKQSGNRKRRVLPRLSLKVEAPTASTVSKMDLVTETRFYPEEMSSKPFTFGAVFMGVLPFVSLGPEGSCLFQVDNLNQSHQVPGRPIDRDCHYQRFGRISWKKFYRKHGSPDVLLVGQTRDAGLDQKWIQRFVRDTTPPKAIVYQHKPDSTLDHMGRLKRQERELKSLDYLSSTRFVSSTACGSPVEGGHLFTFYVQRTAIQDLPGFMDYPLGSDKLSPRGFQNCLTPPGLLRCKRFVGKLAPARNHGRQERLGTFRGKPVVDPSGPAPNSLDFWIQDHRGKFRRLLAEEWARIRGYPSIYEFPPKMARRLATNPGSHEWHQLYEW